MKLPIITTSEVRCFRRCAREHHFSYRLRVRPTYQADALRFGTLFHIGLESWWKSVDLASASAIMRAKEPRSFLETAKADALLTGYHHRWKDEPIEVLAVEAQFDTALVNPETGKPSQTYRLGGKIDAIAKLADGRIAVVEHKTASEDVTIGSDYWKRLRLDAQVSNYLAGARSLGFDATTCLYDVIKKPTFRPLKATAEIKYRKDGQPNAGQRLVDQTPEEYGARIIEDIAEAPDKYFSRAEVVRLDTEREEAAFDLWQTARQMRESELAQRYPRNPDSCIRYGRTCSYFGVCSGQDSLENTTLFRKAEDAHEELVEESSAA